MNFGKQFLVYGVTGAISRLAAMLLVPLYTRTLPMAEYGRLEILLAAHMLLVLLIGLQGESAVGRDFFRARDEGWLRELAWGSLWTTALGLAVLAVVAVPVTLVWEMPDYLWRYLPWLVGVSVMTQLFGIQLAFVRFNGRPYLYGLLTLADITLTAMFSILLIVVFDLGIAGAIGGLAIGKAVPVLAAWPMSFGRPPARAGLSRVRGILAYTMPTVPAVLLNWLQTIGTRVVWALFFALGAVAIAGVGIRVASLFALVVYSFRLAWEPHAFRQLDRTDGASPGFREMLDWAIVLLFAFAAGVICLAPLLVAIFAPPSYREAASLVGPFVLGQAWVGIAVISTIGIHGARVTSRLTYIQAFGSLANVGLLAFLAPRLGLAASAIAFLASAIVVACAGAWYSNSHYETDFSWRLLGAALVSSAVVGAVAIVRPSFDETLLPHPMLVSVVVAAAIAVPLLGIPAERRAGMRRELAEMVGSVQQALRRRP